MPLLHFCSLCGAQTYALAVFLQAVFIIVFVFCIAKLEIINDEDLSVMIGKIGLNISCQYIRSNCEARAQPVI